MMSTTEYVIDKHAQIRQRLEKQGKDSFMAYIRARYAIRTGASDTDAILRDFASVWGFGEYYRNLENAVYVVQRFGCDAQYPPVNEQRAA